MSDRYSIIDPATLPELTLVDIPDKEVIITARMQELKERWIEHDPPLGAAYDVETTEFDPIKITQEASAYFEVNALSFVNSMGRATTLSTAWGDNLDAIGSRYPGGVPRLPGEDDERYRRRLFLSANSYSTAGAGGAYEFQALTVLPNLRDVSATVQRPSLTDHPIVTITCLAESKPTEVQNGKVRLVDRWKTDYTSAPLPPIQDLLLVQARMADTDIVPLTDVIAVSAPQVVEIPYVVDLYLYPNADQTVVIQNVVAALLKLADETRWLGTDHNRMAILGACKVNGVQNAEIPSPAQDVPISDLQVGLVSQIDVRVAGRRT